jgi:hypothetical protein
MLMLSIILVYPLLQFETYWQDITGYETAAYFIDRNRSADLSFYVSEALGFFDDASIVSIQLGS